MPTKQHGYVVNELQHRVESAVRAGASLDQVDARIRGDRAMRHAKRGLPEALVRERPFQVPTRAELG